MAEIPHLLRRLYAQPDLFGKFLNTLSLLEYIGARKIIKSQPQASIDLTMLAHANEELRHAMVLKKAAQKYLKVTTLDYQPEHLLAPNAACNYFQKLDYAAAENIPDVKLNYYLTTYLIEVRAIEFYRQIETFLQTQQTSIFRGILIEEDRHLAEVSQALQAQLPTDLLPALQTLEASLFSEWMAALTQCCTQFSEPALRSAL